MNNKLGRRRLLKISDSFSVEFTAIAVAINGILIVAFSLFDQIVARHGVRLTDINVDITLTIGLSFIYLGGLLRRRKRTAWFASVIVYAFYLGANIEGLTDLASRHGLRFTSIVHALILPIAILVLLIINQKRYVVRSDGPGFRSAIRLSVIILIVSFFYGVAGFLLLSRADFHQSLSVPAAMHYTIDQFNITTNHPIHAYTRRAKLFLDSLSFISAAAVIYVLISFFQPLRSRFGDQSFARQKFRRLIIGQPDATSEDFFKLWPPDKQYFFDSSDSSGLAYHVYGGIALILGGPAGKQSSYGRLLNEFHYLCYSNDWRPAIIHCDDTYRDIYSDLGYSLQKIGQEAIVNVAKFNSQTVKEKYFRNIVNKFNKNNYTAELVSPPHSKALIDRLKFISDDWLRSGNRTERGFAMGYFLESYLNQCELMIARDAAGTIQAFINLVPADYDAQEATYDMLRYCKGSLGNINDYLLIKLCRVLEDRSYGQLNLGFSPLVGLENDDNKSLIDSFLGFAYANGDRFYSFSGLYKFKSKYKPNWRDKYIAYQGGLRGFSRVLNALVQTMRRMAKPTLIKRHSGAEIVNNG